MTIWTTGSEREYAAAAALLDRLWIAEGHLDPTRSAIAWDPIQARRALLSSGEKVVLDVAYALWSGRDGLSSNVADLLRLDPESFECAIDALRFRRGCGVSEYPKIETLYDRDPETFKVIPGQYRLPEFALVDRWLITEKVDGTNVRIEWSLGEDGYADVRYRGRTDAAQMPTFLLDALVHLNLPFAIGEAFDRPSSGVLYGEGYGPKIQKGGNYRSDGPSFRLFDVKVGDWWLNWPDVEDVAEKLGIATVPVWGVFSHAGALQYVESTSAVAFNEGGNPDHIQEGIVARTDPLLFTRRGDRLMWKIKGRDLA